VVFGVDALGAWLVEHLADAGRKKLTALILGDEQERALRQAATVAVRTTAAQMSQSDGERAEQLQMVISQVFGDPAPDPPLTGAMMLLEGLQARIARQLAVLDDASLTQTGQSSANVLGVPGTVLADRLTRNVVREIMLRGSRGGPLTALASELNHELTRLQGQRIELQGQRVESMLTVLAAEIRDAQAMPGRTNGPAGRPIEEVTDPFALEVHRPVQPTGPQSGLSALPTYVPRELDAELGSVVRTVVEGRSAIAVLVGGSSTGKTRACWEALQPLRDEPGLWRLWHPIDPSRPDAALRELPGIGPRTVVWLNEAQFYLDIQEGGLGERVAAGLRELLRDPARTPVLILATVWPQFWDALIARPAGPADPHAQARELLVSHDITVPARFTGAQLEQLRKLADPRLVQAAEAAQDRQVIQYLAGAPELLARYRNAPSAAAAMINVAMDARRLGTGIGLSQAFLEAAVPEYLTDAEWDALGEDWVEEALAYITVPCKGVPGPLTRIRPRRVRSRLDGPSARDSDGRPASELVGPLYRLTDYLDQYGRMHRSSHMPQEGFWAAAACYSSPADQAVLGDAAHDRGLYRAAAQLHKNAAARGSFRAASYLSNPPPYLRADTGSTTWAVAHTTVDDAFSVARLLDSALGAGLLEQAAALAGRAASLVAIDDPFGIARLLAIVRAAGLPEQAAVLAERAAVGVPLHNPFGVEFLLAELQTAGLPEQAAALAGRAAALVPLDDPSDVARLLASVHGAGLPEQAAALAGRAAALVPLDDPSDVVRLLEELQATGLPEQVAVLAGRAAAQAALNDPRGVGLLLGNLRGAGLSDQTAILLRRDPVALSPLTTLPAWPSCWRSCGRRPGRSRLLCWLGVPPRRLPWTTQVAWPGCWVYSRQRACRSRLPYWLGAPPSAFPSMIRLAWLGCFMGLQETAFRSRLPRWRGVPPRMLHWTTPGAWPGCWPVCE
jgi:hypothetical protein